MPVTLLVRPITCTPRVTLWHGPSNPVLLALQFLRSVAVVTHRAFISPVWFCLSPRISGRCVLEALLDSDSGISMRELPRDMLAGKSLTHTVVPPILVCPVFFFSIWRCSKSAWNVEILSLEAIHKARP